jgi:O-antigen ligase
MTLRRAGTVLVLLLAATVLGAMAVGTGRGLAAALAVIAALFGLALAAHGDRYETTADMVTEAGDWVLVAMPGLLIVYFGFNGGGYSPAPVAFAAVILALLLALKLWFSAEPLAGYGALAAIAAGVLLLFGVWTLLSGAWSDAPGRALLEADRVLLYLLALLLFASAVRTTTRMRLILRSIAVGAVIVCTVGLITRVAPDVWPISADLQQGRLGYPLTYWNAFGLLAAIGLILCTHLACSENEPRLVRVLGAAAMPVLGAALFFTFSRGAIAVVILGLVGYVLLSRPRGLVGGLLAGAPATAIAVVSSYGADLLSSDNPTTEAAASQGHDVALVVALCVVGAAVVRVVTLPLDGLMAKVHLPEWAQRWGPAVLWGVGVLVAAAVFVGADGPDRVSSNYDRFVHGNAVVMTGDLRSRLGDPGNNRRIDQWKVGIEGYHEDSFRGLGAGTYENLWNRRRPVRFAILDAHSLYVEVLAELGIAGLILLVVPLALILFALVRGLWRSRDRYVYAALVAALLAWLVRAALDWDWEMPAITIWLFCAGGAALAVSRRARSRAPQLSPLPRLALTLVCLVAAVVPVGIAVSQHRFEDAEGALARGDCPTAEEEARRSLDVIGFRAEPHQLLAYCAARKGDFGRALAEANLAVSRDPGNWRYRYDVALITAADGKDAAAPARTAAALNPREPLATAAPSALSGAGARERALVLLGVSR